MRAHRTRRSTLISLIVLFLLALVVIALILAIQAILAKAVDIVVKVTIAIATMDALILVVAATRWLFRRFGTKPHAGPRVSPVRRTDGAGKISVWPSTQPPSPRSRASNRSG
jgi:hypothetical protein